MDMALVGISGAGIVWAIVQAFKQAFSLPDQVLPLMALVMGVAWNLGLRAAGATEISYGIAAIMGVLSGLAASGLWAQSRPYIGRKP